LTAPAKTSTQVFVDQQYQQVHQQRLRAMTTVGGVRTQGLPGVNVSVPSTQLGNPRSRMILIVLALVLGATFLFEEEQQNVKRTERKPGAGAPAVRSIAQYSNVELPEDIKKKADMFFRVGFREYQEENYLRAITQFNTVLDLTNQGHALALAYRDNALREIDKQMDRLLERGRKAKAAGRLREAKGVYQAVLRMNFGSSSDPKVIEAEEQLKEIQKLEKKEGVGES
jgi:tetratricopeptide (TPR) repeat protein